MFVQGPLFHTWLDQQKKVIGCEALNNWSKTSDLVEVVNLTIEMVLHIFLLFYYIFFK